MKLPAFIRLSKQNVYIFRRRIPTDVAQYFNTKEIRVSLRTGFIRDAVSGARMLAAEADLLFFHLRNNMAIDKNNKLMEILRQKKIDIFRVEENERLRDLLANKQSEIISKNRQHERELSLVHSAKGLGAGPLTKAPMLSSFIAEFLNSESVERRRDKPATVRKDKDALNLFVEIVGDRSINEIRQSDAVKFAKEIRTFKARDTQRATNTANNHMSSISKFSEWISTFHPEAGHTKLDFSGLRFPKASKASDEREMFELDEIKAIFTHPKLHKERVIDSSKFWLLHIALYSGMRLEEIAQLDPSTDIVMSESGILYFDINETGSKSLKTKNSNRQVPVHSALLNLGLMDYINSIKSKSKSLFVDATKRDGRLGKAIGKRTNYFINHTVGVQKTLHSFRHTFATLLKRAMVEESISAALLGHSQGGITYNRYGKQYELKMLQALMEEHIKFDVSQSQKK